MCEEAALTLKEMEAAEQLTVLAMGGWTCNHVYGEAVKQEEGGVLEPDAVHGDGGTAKRRRRRYRSLAAIYVQGSQLASQY
ncbi:hypothetical protein BRADI_2g56115v3 [Brachypodium distachyon]|uniref:Uncharacterized protein n=1 Tax=Brachypodium distachyon TaxID=15368 RepID=A0A0Q3GI32_BRADI|nr:hypothetical protein BRADI_2g56115v3 [Brachypodium distachyon]